MFEGSFTALITPFKNGKIDEKGLEKFIDYQIDNGIHGLVPCGTTGESATLSLEEHEYVVEIAIKKAKGKVPIIAGAGSNNTDDAIRLTTHAKNAGADGALVITPYYNKPTQEGLYRHFKAVAENVDIPIVVYNVPGRTGVNILPETLAKLSEIDNITAVKEASGNILQVSNIIRLCREKISVLSGEDGLVYPILSLGGKGVISASANIAPKEFADICNLYKEGNYQESRNLQLKILPLVKAMFLETNPIPVKTSAFLMGLIDQLELRLPLCEMTDTNLNILKGILKDYNLISCNSNSTGY